MCRCGPVAVEWLSEDDGSKIGYSFRRVICIVCGSSETMTVSRDAKSCVMPYYDLGLMFFTDTDAAKANAKHLQKLDKIYGKGVGNGETEGR